MAVVDGNVMAINPGEEPKMQMFIWNNIFFSLGFDVRDHYKDLGGDAAAFVAPVSYIYRYNISLLTDMALSDITLSQYAGHTFDKNTVLLKFGETHC